MDSGLKNALKIKGIFTNRYYLTSIEYQHITIQCYLFQFALDEPQLKLKLGGVLTSTK